MDDASYIQKEDVLKFVRARIAQLKQFKAHFEQNGCPNPKTIPLLGDAIKRWEDVELVVLNDIPTHVLVKDS
jgi:hypothetical protein